MGNRSRPRVATQPKPDRDLNQRARSGEAAKPRVDEPFALEPRWRRLRDMAGTARRAKRPDRGFRNDDAGTPRAANRSRDLIHCLELVHDPGQGYPGTPPQGVFVKLPGRFTEIPERRKLPGRFTEAAGELPGRFTEAGELPRRFTEAAGELPRRFTGAAGELPRRFTEAAGELPRRFTGAAGELPRRFTGAAGELPGRFTGADLSPGLGGGEGTGDC